jgi:hypothetical protein
MQAIHELRVIGQTGRWRFYAEADVELDRTTVSRHSPR